MAFDFTPRFPIAGGHRFEALPGPEPATTVLVEDAFDRAEAELAGKPWQPRPLPAHVRALRWVAGRLA